MDEDTMILIGGAVLLLYFSKPLMKTFGIVDNTLGTASNVVDSALTVVDHAVDPKYKIIDQLSLTDIAFPMFSQDAWNKEFDSILAGVKSWF